MAEKERASASLQKVTDYVEEREIDSEKSKHAMSSLIETTSSTTEASTSEEVKQKVDIRPEDVDLIVRELECSKERAVEVLRANNGKVEPALVELVRA